MQDASLAGLLLYLVLMKWLWDWPGLSSLLLNLLLYRASLFPKASSQSRYSDFFMMTTFQEKGIGLLTSRPNSHTVWTLPLSICQSKTENQTGFKGMENQHPVWLEWVAYTFWNGSIWLWPPSDQLTSVRLSRVLFQKHP